MDPTYERIIVLSIVFLAGFLTWKMVKDFYITKLHKVLTHLIAVATSTFMLLSTTFLFMPKDYQRGSGSELELSFMSVFTVIVMLAVLYVFFKYSPQNNRKE